MPLLDAFVAALVDRSTGRLSPLKLAQMLGTVAGSVEAYENPNAQALLTNLIGPWALSVAQKAPAKWALPLNVAPACALEVNAGTCGAFAVGGCHCCGRPICLGHALVGGDATLVCWACVRTAAAHVKPWRHSGADASAGSAWAYELLGLQPGCTPEDAKKAYKQRVAHFHPDRVGAGEQSKPNGDLLRLLKRAYDVVTADGQDRT